MRYYADGKSPPLPCLLLTCHIMCGSPVCPLRQVRCGGCTFYSSSKVSTYPSIMCRLPWSFNGSMPTVWWRYCLDGCRVQPWHLMGLCRPHLCPPLPLMVLCWVIHWIWALGEELSSHTTQGKWINPLLKFNKRMCPCEGGLPSSIYIKKKDSYNENNNAIYSSYISQESNSWNALPVKLMSVYKSKLEQVKKKPHKEWGKM